jgi:hypothetical protein
VQAASTVANASAKAAAAESAAEGRGAEAHAAVVVAAGACEAEEGCACALKKCVHPAREAEAPAASIGLEPTSTVGADGGRGGSPQDPRGGGTCGCARSRGSRGEDLCGQLRAGLPARDRSRGWRRLDHKG